MPDKACRFGERGRDPQRYTVLRWHRDLLTARHANMPKPKRRGRQPTVRAIRILVLRLARDSPGWGYRRIHGEFATLRTKVAASTVWEISRPPASPRDARP